MLSLCLITGRTLYMWIIPRSLSPEEMVDREQRLRQPTRGQVIIIYLVTLLLVTNHRAQSPSSVSGTAPPCPPPTSPSRRHRPSTAALMQAAETRWLRPTGQRDPAAAVRQTRCRRRARRSSRCAPTPSTPGGCAARSIAPSRRAFAVSQGSSGPIGSRGSSGRCRCRATCVCDGCAKRRALALSAQRAASPRPPWLGARKKQAAQALIGRPSEV